MPAYVGICTGQPHEFQYRFDIPSNIFTTSAAVASVCELTAPGDQPKLGNAGITVRNVIPNDGNAIIWIYIDFPNPLPIQITLFVDTAPLKAVCGPF